MLIHTSLSISSWPKTLAAACCMTNSLSRKALVIHLMDFAIGRKYDLPNLRVHVLWKAGGGFDPPTRALML